MVDYGYLTSGSPVKDRLLINLTDNSYNTPLGLACVEASRLVDIFLTPYVATLPLTLPDAMVQMVTADFAASIFKRRQFPTEQSMKPALQPDMINDVDGTGWFAVGLKRLQDYIKVKYALGVKVPSSVSNPEIYAQLFKDGTITLMELRTYLTDPEATINKKLNEIKVLQTSMSDTILKNIVERTYKTSQKHSFAFITSDGDGGYRIIHGRHREEDED